MEFKRNYSSNIQQSQVKTSPLIQPLLNIAKASTPVRTRIVKPGSQMNSTPINVHKIGHPNKSPALTNKENDQNSSQIQIKKPKITQQNINLSPIMALNRKITEGPKQQNRSLTPNGFKRQQSLADILRQSRNNQTNNNQPFTPANQYQTVGFRSSKAFGQTLQARTSNSFKTLIESRAKTPNLQNSGKKINDSGYHLRSSGSAQSLLSGMKKLRDSKCSRMSESRSFDQLLSLGNSKIREDQILCSNEHKQKLIAKYKVVKLNDYDDDEEMLVYCSKCAIGLVNQNFKVQELTKQQKNYIKMQRMDKSKTEQYPQQHYQNNKFSQYTQQTKEKLQQKLQQIKYQKQKVTCQYDKDLLDIDSYYNSIITLIEEQRVKDRQSVIKVRDQNKKTVETAENKVSLALRQIDAIISERAFSHNNLMEIQSYQSLVHEKCKTPQKNIYMNEDIQQKFDYFSQMFQNSIKLYFNSEKMKKNFFKNPNPNLNMNTNMNGNNDKYYAFPENSKIIPADSALRFSFEKMLKMKQKNQINKYQGGMNPLEEAEQEMQAEESLEYVDRNDEIEQKKAFRTLFPQGETQQPKPDMHSPTFKQF